MKCDVVISAYNVEDYIAGCIESVLAQTYPDTAVVIIDDGSTDSTLNIIKEYARKSAKIQYYHQNNQGPSAARHNGLMHCDGEYVSFIDADDWLDPDYCSQLVRAIEDSGSDISVCTYYLEKQGYNRPSASKSVYVGTLAAPEAIKYLCEASDANGYLWNKMFRRKLLNEKCFLDESVRYGEDCHTLFTALTNSETITFINESLYHHRISVNSITNGGSRINYMKCYAAYSRLEESLRSCFPEQSSAVSAFIVSQRNLALFLARPDDQLKDASFICASRSDVRKQMWTLICSGMSLKWKIAGLLFSISPGLFFALFKVFY